MELIKLIKNYFFAVGILLFFAFLSFTSKKNPVILIRCGWQVENIGDIAHTSVFLALAEKYIPKAKVIFWPYYHYLPENEVKKLKRRFPKMVIVQGKLSADGISSTPELAAAIEESTILINNSERNTIV